MLMKNIVKSSAMPPRRDTELRPHLEKRRIVGSLRERTVYLQSPPSSQNFSDDRVCELRKSALFEQLLNDLANRISNHVERELTVQQITIDQKIEEIDEHTQSNLLTQETLETRLKKLRKKLKQKSYSYSQPVTSSRSGLALYNHHYNHFTSSPLEDSDNFDENGGIPLKDNKKNPIECERISNEFPRLMLTNLW